MKISREKILYTVFLIITVFIISDTAVFAKEMETKFVIQDGESLLLHGDWEFYWQELLEPKDFLDRHGESTSITVPGSWKKQSINGEPLSSTGYGTYRTTIKVPKEYIGKQLAITMYYVGSAYRIWINGNEYTGLGKVGKSQEKEIPQLQRNIVVFVATTEVLEVVLQVSNFSFRDGGILSDITLGQVHNIIQSVFKGLHQNL